MRVNVAKWMSAALTRLGAACRYLVSLRRRRARLELVSDLQKPKSLAAVAIVVIGVVLQAIISQSAFATSVTNFPTALGTNSWTSAANAEAADTNNATAAPGKNATVNGIWKTFGFGTIPSNATINSVVINVRYMISATNTVTQLNVTPLYTGVACGAAQTDTSRPTAMTVKTFDVTSCRSWAVADLNDTNFSVQIGAQKGNSNTTFTFSMDYVSVTVGYSIPITYNQASYRVFNNQDVSGQNSFISAYGTANDDPDYGIVQLSDGGYVTCGYTATTAAQHQLLLARYDKNGSVVWSEKWGTVANNNIDECLGITKTSDGNIAVFGRGTYGSNTNGVVLDKLDLSGNELFSSGWNNGFNDFGLALAPTSDGGYIATGFAPTGAANGNDIVTIKFSSTGTVAWSSDWGGTGTDEGFSVVQTSDGGYAVTGETNSAGGGGYDAVLLRYDSSGNLLWNTLWGGSGNDYGYSLLQTSDGGYLITGQTLSYGDTTNGDMMVAKFNSSGSLLWSKTWGGTGADVGKSIVQTSDGGYAVAGQTLSYNDTANGDAFLLKLDSSFNLIWQKAFGGSTAAESGRQVIQTSDGGYAVTAYTSSYTAGGQDGYIWKTDASGNVASCTSPCTTPTGSLTSQTASTTSASLTGSISGTLNQSLGLPYASVSFTTNVVAALTNPSIDVGSPLAAANTAAGVPGDGQPFRVRMDVGISSSDLAASGQSFKLQYASNGASACNTSPPSSWSDVTDTSAGVKFYDNPIATNGTTLTVNANDPPDGTNTTANGGVVTQSYQEKGTTSFANAAAVTSGKDGMWDFALTTYQSLQNTHYCLRITASDGTALNTYTNYPDLITPAATYRQGADRWFKNSGSTAFTQVSSNPSTSADSIARAVQYDTNGNMYTAGFCSGQNNWCLEKRSSATGSLSYTVNEGGFPAGGQGVYGLAIDQANDALFMVGYDTPSGSNQEWRIEKRTMSTGALVSGFGTGGIIKEDISANGEQATGVAIDPSGGFIYVIGVDSSGTTGKWRLEKRATSNGALSYGVSETISANSDSPLAIKLDTAGGFAYIVGYDQLNSVPTQNEWRIEKRTLSTGALVSGFGTSGGISESISTGVDQAYDLALDTSNGFIYVVGSDNNAGSALEWRIEKRSTSTGGLVSGFGTGGAISEHVSFSSDEAYTAQVDPAGGYLYVGGYDESPSGSYNEWRIEKRTTSTGGLVSGFGTSGAVTERISSTNDAIYASAIDVANGALYVVGDDTSSGIWLGWRTEKRNTSDGSFFNGINMSPLATQNQILYITSLAVPVHLKVDVGPVGSGVAASGQTFKLQYANKTSSCAASTFSDVTAATPIRWFDDTSITGGATVAANANDPVDGTNSNVYETYQEANSFSNATQVFVGQDGLWDFSLVVPTGTQLGTDICLRISDGSGNPLSTYNVYPEIQYGPRTVQRFRGGKFFLNDGVLEPYFLGN